MGIYIRGMTKAKNCSECHFFHIESFQKWCCITEREDIFLDAIPEWCPLTEIKTPHGDLIDRQKLLEDNKHLEYPTDEKYRRDRAWAVGFNAGARHCNEHAVYAKTVVEGEGAEE